MLIIPSSTLRSRYIRTIPIGTVVKDPVNGHSYLIEEKKLNNNSLVKVATAYIGNEPPIELTVDEQHLKIINPKRANVNMILKNRVAELEEKVSILNSQLKTRSKYEQIKHLMNGDEYYEDEKYLYLVKDGIIWPIKNNGSFEHTKGELDEYVKTAWKSPQLLHSLILGQKRLQPKLLDSLSKDSMEKEIQFSS